MPLVCASDVSHIPVNTGELRLAARSGGFFCLDQCTFASKQTLGVLPKGLKLLTFLFELSDDCGVLELDRLFLHLGFHHLELGADLSVLLLDQRQVLPEIRITIQYRSGSVIADVSCAAGFP